MARRGESWTAGASRRHAGGGPRSSEGLGVAVVELDTTDPIALASGQAITLALAVERHRCSLQKRGRDTLERIYADHRVDMTVDGACDHGNDAAVRTNMKLSSLRPEGIDRDLLGVLDVDCK